MEINYIHKLKLGVIQILGGVQIHVDAHKKKIHKESLRDLRYFTNSLHERIRWLAVITTV